ncbi:hypothetical protein [Burkholderia multivorans]|uniref:hypothetical protein n=1 Tax=Burkholderia multivorans TaxID=87883 RepID=UPI0021BF6C82|nr:hypothetical protein [Burkholderia multivorans]MDR9052108.1 hypothetical protein [Burkholderia multivorans]MDR9060481.1 hypothetical protein [Burkholderia multivorans]MDR9066407.1 hypothetical protein [Burkholderia multivorans]MDR9072363.1 hypothetical protein [Burkholderia multivorans]MDR9078351.1 hypothetical protein [Burkholderia multivorans]
MESTISDGGPAFPSRRDVPYPGGGSHRDDRPGMTLRDYFAAKAIAGLLADPNVKLGEDRTDKVAVLAYSVADAMLRAREGL